MNSQAVDNQFPHRISLSQAAELSGYHQDYLGQLCRLGKIKAAKIGRNWYTTQTELQSLLNFTDAIEMESGSFNGQVAAEEEKGLFDFSPSEVEPDLTTNSASLDSVHLVTPIENIVQKEPILVTEEQVRIEPATKAVVPTPVVVDNYVISEVDGIPIRLQADNPAKQHHTIQTLITRMKLDSLREEVLQVSEVVQTMSDELAAVKEMVAKHEQVLRNRKDLATAYAASIDIMPEPAVREQELLSLEDKSEPQTATVWQLAWAPSIAVFLVVGLMGWLIASNLPARNSQLSTIKYQPTILPQDGLVAGDNTSSFGESLGANINIEP